MPSVADDDHPGRDLRVDNTVSVASARTLFETIVILRGLRQWHERRNTALWQPARMRHCPRDVIFSLAQ